MCPCWSVWRSCTGAGVKSVVLLDLFLHIKANKVPISLREWLDLLAALKQRLVVCDWDEFYALARCVCVKNEKYYDRFDKAMQTYYDGIDAVDPELLEQQLPEEWLRKHIESKLSADELNQLQKFKDLEELMQQFKERLKEQKHRHQGGNRMVGTGGRSPFGAYGDHPEGMRLAGPSRNKHAVKVWEKRRFRNLDGDAALETRNMQMALRRLRAITREGAADEFSIDKTIDATAKQAGWLDVQYEPERRNAVKALLFFDIGGSMDPYVALCETLFSAAKSEFKHLHYYYFHNFFYETVWTSGLRRRQDEVSFWDLLHTYSSDYKVMIIGDATMGPYEIAAPGGSVEHWNQEPGAVWFQRLTSHFKHVVWFNPCAKDDWPYIPSVQQVLELTENQMYPLTLDGLSQGVQAMMR